MSLALISPQSEDTKTLNYYLDNPSEFGELSPEETSNKWEEWKKDNSGLTNLKKNVIIRETINDIINKKNQEAKIATILGSEATTDLPTINPNGINGFENQALTWSTDKKNIIGDGTTFLKLDNLPAGTTGIRYLSKEEGFVLTLENDKKLYIKDTGIDKEGQLSLGTHSSGPKEGQPISMEDFELIQVDANDKITLTKNGFLLDKNAKLKFKDITFIKNPNSIVEGTVRFDSDNIFVTKGVNIIKENIVEIIPHSFESQGQRVFLETVLATGNVDQSKLSNYRETYVITNTVSSEGVEMTDITAVGTGTLKILGDINQIDVGQNNFAIINGISKEGIPLTIYTNDGKIDYTRVLYEGEEIHKINKIKTNKAEAVVKPSREGYMDIKILIDQPPVEAQKPVPIKKEWVSLGEKVTTFIKPILKTDYQVFDSIADRSIAEKIKNVKSPNEFLDLIENIEFRTNTVFLNEGLPFFPGTLREDFTKGFDEQITKLKIVGLTRKNINKAKSIFEANLPERILAGTQITNHWIPKGQGSPSMTFIVEGKKETIQIPEKDREGFKLILIESYRQILRDGNAKQKMLEFCNMVGEKYCR